MEGVSNQREYCKPMPTKSTTVTCWGCAIGETISKDHGIRDLFMQAVYDQVGASAKDGGPAQGSNFWNLYTVGTGTDDPYQITLADTTTMGVIHTHVRPPWMYPFLPFEEVKISITHAGSLQAPRTFCDCWGS